MDWLTVCVCVCALKGKWLELSTRNLVDIESMAVTQWRSEVNVTALSNVLLAWVYMSVGLLTFSGCVWLSLVGHVQFGPSVVRALSSVQHRVGTIFLSRGCASWSRGWQVQTTMDAGGALPHLHDSPFKHFKIYIRIICLWKCYEACSSGNISLRSLAITVLGLLPMSSWIFGIDRSGSAAVCCWINECIY